MAATHAAAPAAAAAAAGAAAAQQQRGQQREGGARRSRNFVFVRRWQLPLDPQLLTHLWSATATTTVPAGQASAPSSAP